MFRALFRRAVPRRFHLSALLEHQVLDVSGGRVMQGLFRGMHYVNASNGSVWLPKLLGTYELELTDELRRLLGRQPGRCVVVGAAEGYFAVGFAMQPSVMRVVAFEPTLRAQQLIAEMADHNGVFHKITVRGICDVPSLRSELVSSGHALLFMDIEGGEAILLDPAQLGTLEHCDIVVELHEFAVPGVGALIRRRFENSHRIIEVTGRARKIEDFPIALGSLALRLKGGAAVQSMSERRPAAMSWLVMTPIRERA